MVLKGICLTVNEIWWLKFATTLESNNIDNITFGNFISRPVEFIEIGRTLWYLFVCVYNVWYFNFVTNNSIPNSNVVGVYQLLWRLCVCVFGVRVVLYRYRITVRSGAALRSPPGRTNRRLTRNESRYHSGESLHYKEPSAVSRRASVIGVMS